jgi:Cu(I)/Ag(I) efflux system membrane protein CusA/SilA
MVDAAIVVTENAYNRLLNYTPPSVPPLSGEGSKSLLPPGRGKSPKGNGGITLNHRIKIITASSKEVAGPLMFAILIIILSFVPIFALTGQEGKLFTPLAFTNMFAMLGTLIASLFLVPVLCVFFLKGKLKKDHEIPVVRFFQMLYKPVLIAALKFRKAAILISLAMLVV